MRHCAAIILTREDGAFLLQHRAENAKRAPGMWGFFGGGIEGDETPEDAVLREAEEELSIRLVGHTLAFERHSVWKEGEGMLHVFVAPFALQETVSQREGQGMDWFTLADLATLNIIPADKIALEDIAARGGLHA